MSNLHWILVEDSERKTPLVSGFLQRTGLNYTHLNVQTPKEYKFPANRGVPHGTLQRNLALQWLRDTFSTGASQSGVVYFADDDNAYSLELFDEVRRSNSFSCYALLFIVQTDFRLCFYLSDTNYQNGVRVACGVCWRPPLRGP